eukprot:TRINITY_DN7341_c0_g1_i1.p1 TRINITY_DN7341_c0_g1~~TRINITY_DN7341_c0_g1_i1.p1  ORF type:complete len:324 (+),score=68.21 TRINITY_DN7341_c0_g1_i1:59-1030(+)
MENSQRPNVHGNSSKATKEANNKSPSSMTPNKKQLQSLSRPAILTRDEEIRFVAKAKTSCVPRLKPLERQLELIAEYKVPLRRPPKDATQNMRTACETKYIKDRLRNRMEQEMFYKATDRFDSSIDLSLSAESSPRPSHMEQFHIVREGLASGTLDCLLLEPEVASEVEMWRREASVLHRSRSSTPATVEKESDFARHQRSLMMKRKDYPVWTTPVKVKDVEKSISSPQLRSSTPISLHQAELMRKQFISLKGQSNHPALRHSSPMLFRQCPSPFRIASPEHPFRATKSPQSPPTQYSSDSSVTDSNATDEFGSFCKRAMAFS